MDGGGGDSGGNFGNDSAYAHVSSGMPLGAGDSGPVAGDKPRRYSLLAQGLAWTALLAIATWSIYMLIRFFI